MMHKKAEMGVGTLIIFIAMLLVAAVAAGVLIQTVGSLQEKGLSTGTQAKGQISTNAKVVEISATDGTDTYVDDFTQIMKLAPGSDPIKLEDVIMTVNTYTRTATLQYRGTTGTYERDAISGYNTRDEQEIGVLGNTSNNVTLEEDLDQDGSRDYMRVMGGGIFQFNLSTAGLINISSGADLSAADTTVTLTSSAIQRSGTVYGYLTVNGTTDSAYHFPLSANITVEPYPYGTGYFTVEYLQQGSNWVNGNLQRGDVIKVYYESPGKVGEAEEVRVNFIPKIGTATLALFTTPEVMSTERVYLYP
ncbi:hypothetical protein D6764_04485 [Candidatus Woesearchaeota archaeon]|nr:MAG: hypothetical protein D6764_04485 [Candidatus Woesearchaeota archaeon]